MKKLFRMFVCGASLCGLLLAIWVMRTKEYGNVSAERKLSAKEAYAEVRSKALQNQAQSNLAMHYGLGVATEKLSGGQARVEYAVGHDVISGVQKYDIEITPVKSTLGADGQTRQEQAGQSITIHQASAATGISGQSLLSGEAVINADSLANSVVIKCTPIGGLIKKAITHTISLRSTMVSNAVIVTKKRVDEGGGCELVESSCSPDSSGCGTMSCYCSGNITTSCVSCVLECTECPPREN